MKLERHCPACSRRGMRLETRGGTVRRRHETVTSATAVCDHCDYRVDGELTEGPEGRYFLSHYRRDTYR